MNWKEIANAILLETMFAVWCDHMYERFSQGGNETARKVFIRMTRPLVK